MLAQSSPRQSQPMPNGADSQGSTGHYAQRRIRQRVNPFRMHIFGKQRIDEIVGVFEFSFLLRAAIGFSRRVTSAGKDSYSFNLNSIFCCTSCTCSDLIARPEFFSQKNSASTILLLPRPLKK